MDSQILILAPQPFFELRGTPLNVRLILETLSEAGYSCDILAYPYGETLNIKNIKTIRSSRLPFVKEVPIGFSYRKFALDFLFMLKALWLIIKGRYRVIHAVEESAFFGWILKPVKKYKFIYDLDSSISESLAESKTFGAKFLSKIAVFLEKLALKNSDRAITVCQSLSDNVARIIPTSRILQLEDAPLSDNFEFDARQADQIRKGFAANGKFLFVYAGNLEPIQGLELLMRAANIVIAKNNKVRFLIIGSGSKKRTNYLLSLAKELKLDKHFFFLGPKPPLETAAYYGAADALLSPRIFGKNTPLKIYTYMQTGKPIVATNLVTHTQVLDDKSAILAEATEEKFAEALLFAVNHYETALARAALALEKFQAKYTREEFKRKLLSFYQTLYQPDSHFNG
ncbi:MAG TPA: glycosyltransferase [Oligoflexia bacterium]|nr:glycosyltransferase [Oligoflexia bacterium]HMP27794.1 glycosyltransferase [Oligoflexia bacterium]